MSYASRLRALWGRHVSWKSPMCPRMRLGSCWLEERKRKVFPHWGFIDLPSRKINYFFTCLHRPLPPIFYWLSPPCLVVGWSTAGLAYKKYALPYCVTPCEIWNLLITAQVEKYGGSRFSLGKVRRARKKCNNHITYALLSFHLL